MANSSQQNAPLVAKVVSLNGEKLLVVKFENESPSGKWELNIDLKPEMLGGGGCGAQCSQCAKCDAKICEQ